jgi:hypothetical protein
MNFIAFPEPPRAPTFRPVKFINLATHSSRFTHAITFKELEQNFPLEIKSQGNPFSVGHTKFWPFSRKIAFRA